MIILNEGLEEVANGVFCTDYVGDVVNLILNKPKPYRIVYDERHDVWGICDANESTHYGLAKSAIESGYIQVDDGDTKIIQQRINWGTKHNPDTGKPMATSNFSDKAAYYGYYLDDWFVGCMFLPSGSTYSDEGTGFYTYPIEISSGIVYTQDEYAVTGYLQELFECLNDRDAIEDKHADWL